MVVALTPPVKPSMHFANKVENNNSLVQSFMRKKEKDDNDWSSWLAVPFGHHFTHEIPIEIKGKIKVMEESSHR